MGYLEVGIVTYGDWEVDIVTYGELGGENSHIWAQAAFHMGPFGNAAWGELGGVYGHMWVWGSEYSHT